MDQFLIRTQVHYICDAEELLQDDAMMSVAAQLDEQGTVYMTTFSGENAMLLLPFGCPSTQERCFHFLKTEQYGNGLQSVKI